MATTVEMQHRTTGIRKQGFFGFSWTYLFFGFWVPLFRGHFAMAGIHLVVSIVSVFAFGIPQIVLAFFFNKFYTLRLIEDGYDFDDKPELVATACRVLNIAPAK